jgi:hypothetical protein
VTYIGSQFGVRVTPIAQQLRLAGAQSQQSQACSLTVQSRSTGFARSQSSVTPSTSSAVLTPPLVASREVITVALTFVDCGMKRCGMTSIECLHEYARRVGRYPRLGLFGADIEETIGPSSPEANPPSPPLPSILTDKSFVSSSVDDREVTLEDTKDDDDEYLPTRRTTQPRRRTKDVAAASTRMKTSSEHLTSPAPQASSSRVSAGPAANKRVRWRSESPDDKEGSTKRHKSNKDNASTSTALPPGTSHVTKTDPKTGRQFIVVRDRKGKVLQYRCPVHSNLNVSRKGDMDRHLLTRDHQQPSYCCVESCGEKYTRIDSLKRHIDNHHPKGSLEVVEHETGAETYVAEGRHRRSPRR